jgi:hypothetical protein
MKPVLELAAAVLIVLGAMLLIDAIGYIGPNDYAGIKRYKDASRYMHDEVRPW